MDALVDAINATGYGLTFGLHTRLDETVARVTARVKAGNIYVNRNVIGAIVGVQPFGGRGLSGTGPKAGGPLYLGRLTRTAPVFAERVGYLASPIHDFVSWLEAQDDHEAAAVARHYGDASALGVELALPGPVGETNLYALHSRGLLLLRPGTRRGLLAQMAAVLATGNRAVIEGAPLPQGLPASVAAHFLAQPDAPFAAMLVEGDADQILAATQAVAELDGPIVTVHAAAPGDERAWHLDWLLEEVSTSINTTAAGGNASLMMIG